MRKLTIIISVIAAMALSVTAAGANGRWDTQVTGGVTFDAGGYTDVELDVSSRLDAEGVAKGQIQYVRSDLSFHIAVDCVYKAPDGSYAFAGPTNVQFGSYGDYVSVEVSHDGNELRVRPIAAPAPDTDTGTDTCGYTGDYKASVKTGSFNIK